MFLDFCKSGHIGEPEILKIRLFDGRYELVRSMVARVLLRMQRRFYDGGKSYVKNLVQCRPEDPVPDHFARLAILHWLTQRLSVKGPAGVNGFQSVGALVEALARVGHDALTVREELLYLTKERCVVPEHLRTEALEDGDLVKITAAGSVHLMLMADPDYLAACAEDTYVSDRALAERIARRCTERDIEGHLSRSTTARNASDLLEYLRREAATRFSAPEVFLSEESVPELRLLREAEAALGAAEMEVSRKLFVANLPSRTSADELKSAFTKAGIRVERVGIPEGGRGYGFVHVADGQAAMQALAADGSLRIAEKQLRIEEAQDEVTTAKATRRTTATSEFVFVGNLPFRADATAVRQLFAEHDLVAIDVGIRADGRTGRPLGYAFVSLRTVQDAQAAIDRIDGADLQGRQLVVRARTRGRQSGGAAAPAPRSL